MLYFAYGSNLCVARLRRRVPSARLVGLARLDGFELRWHKRSRDGSGKCTIVVSRAEGAHVLGALYAIPPADKRLLDEAEGLGAGYDERAVTVQGERGGAAAWTYAAAGSHVDPSLRPYAWYRDLVIEGAASIGLPSDYVAALGRVEVRADTDPARERRNRGDLPCVRPPRHQTPCAKPAADPVVGSSAP